LLDAAVALRPRNNAFLRQQVHEPSTLEEADAELLALAHELASPVVLTGDVVDAGGHPAVAPAQQVPAGGVTTAPVAIPSLQLTA
jgi:hypothetical protein